MKKNITYKNAPAEDAVSLYDGNILSDFLPPPEKLIRRGSKVKVTISLNQQTLDYFKTFAREHNIKYQTMINEILDTYAAKFA